jgi:predicted negative regulator of RcsB-dependent stress response
VSAALEDYFLARECGCDWYDSSEFLRHLRKAKFHDAVIAVCNALIEPEALLAPTSNEHLSYLFLTRGEAKYWLGDRDGAFLDYDGALAHDPANAAARADRAEVSIERRDFQGAMEDLARLGDNDAFVLRLRGDALAGLGRVQEARAVWSAAVALGDAIARKRLGRD